MLRNLILIVVSAFLTSCAVNNNRHVYNGNLYYRYAVNQSLNRIDITIVNTGSHPICLSSGQIDADKNIVTGYAVVIDGVPLEHIARDDVPDISRLGFFLNSGSSMVKYIQLSELIIIDQYQIERADVELNIAHRLALGPRDQCLFDEHWGYVG